MIVRTFRAVIKSTKSLKEWEAAYQFKNMINVTKDSTRLLRKRDAQRKLLKKINRFVFPRRKRAITGIGEEEKKQTNRR